MSRVRMPEPNKYVDLNDGRVYVTPGPNREVMGNNGRPVNWGKEEKKNDLVIGPGDRNSGYKSILSADDETLNKTDMEREHLVESFEREGVGYVDSTVDLLVKTRNNKRSGNVDFRYLGDGEFSLTNRDTGGEIIIDVKKKIRTYKTNDEVIRKCVGDDIESLKSSGVCDITYVRDASDGKGVIGKYPLNPASRGFMKLSYKDEKGKDVTLYRPFEESI